MLGTVSLSANTSWYLYNFRRSTIERLKNDGYNVICLSPRDDYSQRLVSELECHWVDLNIDNHGQNPILELGLVYRLWRFYRREQPAAALHFTIKNNVYGTWAAYAAGVPVINNVSGLGTAFIRGGVVSILVRLLYRMSQPFAKHVFCQNEEDYRLLVNERLVPENRLELLPGSGVNLERFVPVKSYARTTPFRFLYAGRMLADKGLNELIDAMRRLNSKGLVCKLSLYGFADVENVSAINESQLSEWSKEAGIEWLGPTDSIEKVMAGADAFVLPSYREGLPRSLLEAGAMGLPVVATNVPGCRSVVTDGFNGLLCEPRDSYSLELAMRKMMVMESEERQRLGKNARRRVEQEFDENLVVESTLRVIERCIYENR